MDVDGSGSEGSEASHMEEEPENSDIGELDNFVLEQACRKKDYDKISDRQIEILEVALSHVQQHQKSLGIQLGSQWEGKKTLQGI